MIENTIAFTKLTHKQINNRNSDYNYFWCLITSFCIALPQKTLDEQIVMIGNNITMDSYDWKHMDNLMTELV